MNKQSRQILTAFLSSAMFGISACSTTTKRVGPSYAATTNLPPDTAFERGITIRVLLIRACPWILSCIAIVGCVGGSPPRFEGDSLENYDKYTKYHLVDHDDGYEIHLFYKLNFDDSPLLWDLLLLSLMVPGDNHYAEFAERCAEHIYLVARHYAESADEIGAYLDWEALKKLRDDISISPGDYQEKSISKDIRYSVSSRRTFSGDRSPYECHAYAYFRWKAAQ